MSEGRTFDPSRYLSRVSGADYLEVKWRLVWLREVDRDARIETELVSLSDQQAVFRAVVTLTTGGLATGYGSETPRDFRDYIEKAETKAIGRALAALGFGTQFSAHEFGGEADADRPVDAPVTHSAGSGATFPHRDRSTTVNTVPQARAGLPPTEPQFRKVWAVARALGMSDDDLHQFAGVASLNDLDRARMSELIEKLQALEGEGPEETPSIVNWTEFWAAARRAGFQTKGEIEPVIGALGPDPNAALTRLVAWQREHVHQQAMVS